MVKIALCGKMRSGKDTVADQLETIFGFRKYKFSKGIWDTIDNLWGIVDNGFTPKPRKMLQDVGQKLREIDEDVWVNYMLSEIMVDEMIEKNRNFDVVITDLRQPNEYARLKDEGFTIVRIVADEKGRIQRARARNDSFVAPDMVHETEMHVDSFEVDYEIENNGSLEELSQKVNDMMADIRAKVRTTGGR